MVKVENAWCASSEFKIKVAEYPRANLRNGPWKEVATELANVPLREKICGHELRSKHSEPRLPLKGKNV